jgi:isopentenyl-diphosphate delta-isomerase
MPGDEPLDLVDENDKVIGVAALRSCLEQGLLHRAVAVLVLRSTGRILLQQRSKRDLWHPGLWTLSCTGHVREGETYRAAARRELAEELGLRSPLRVFSKLLLPPISSRGLTEWEWVSLFISKSDQHVTADPAELETVKEVSTSELRRMLAEPRLTPDAKILLGAFLRSHGKQPEHEIHLSA